MAGGDDLSADRTERLERYLALREERPDWFSGPADGVLISTSPAEIAQIESTVAERYVAAGTPARWAAVGIRYEDPYLLLLVDAVTFPTGDVGVHHRIVRRTPAESGVVILPLLEGRLVLIRHFRHALRQWTWEFPRGGVDSGATPDETVRRELMEEIGAPVVTLRPLGRVYGATSLMGMAVAIYTAQVGQVGAVARGEGIGEVRTVAVAEFEAMIRAGEVVDGFTLAAFLHARLAGLV